MPAPQASEANTAVSLRSVSLVTFCSFAQLLVLFVLQMALAKLFGASQEMDVYLAVLAVPLVVGTVLSNSLGSVIIPLSHELNAERGDEAVQAVLSRLGLILLAGSTAMAMLIMFAAGPITRWLCAGFTDSQIELGIAMLAVLAWLIPLNTLTSFLHAVYHARQRFLLPAVTGLAGPVVTVAIVVLFPGAGVRGIAWAVLIGGITGVLLLSPGTPRGGFAENVPFKQWLARFGLLLWPLILGAAYFRLDPLVDRHLAAGAQLTEGSISHLGYAWRLIMAVAVLASGGLSIVAFPAMARHAASGEEEKLASELAHGWRFLCVVLLPMIGGLLCFSETLVAWLLERGQFTPADTKAVARLMCWYSVVILAGGVGEISTRAFFALGKMWTPTLIAMLGFTLGCLAKFALVSRYRAEGLAAVTTAYYVFNNLVFLVLLRFCINGSLFQQLAGTCLRTLICTGCALGVAAPFLRTGTGLQVPLGIALSVLCYLGLQWLWGDEFAVRIWQGFRRFLQAPNLTQDSSTPKH